MKRIFILLFFVVAMAVWSTPSFAARQVIGSSSPLSAAPNGETDGVTMTGLITLTVGTQDIFTANNIAVPATTPSAVSTTVNSEGSIQFNGNSHVYGGLGASGLILLDVNAADLTTIDLRGTAFVTTLTVGTGTWGFNSGTTTGTVTNTILSGDGTISLSEGTKVTNGAGLTTTVAAANGTGTLSLGSGSHWVGAVGSGAFMLKEVNVDGGSTAGVSATITGAVDAHSFDLGTNTLNILGGALSLNNDGVGGVINTTIAGTGSTQYGHILAPAGAFTAQALTVNVTVPTGTYIPLGQLYNIVDALSSPGGYVVTVVVNNPLYTFEPFPVAGTAADGHVTLKTTGNPIKPVTPSTNSNAPMAAAVADALLTLPVTSPVVIAINNLTTADAVANAEAQLAPSTPSLAVPLVTYQGIRAFQDLWLSRLDGCGQVSWPSEDKENCKGKSASSGWWLKGFGYFGEQDARDAFTQYNSTIIGSMLAYDISVGLNTRAGVGFGYARTAIKGSTFDARTDFDTYQGLVYIGHEAGSWFVDASGSFGWNQYQDNRHIQFPGIDLTARSKYSGQDYTAFGRAGFHLPSVFEFIITPTASLQYTRINIDGRSEREAGTDVNLVVKSQHYDYLESGLGAKIERNFDFRNLTLVPEGHFEWLHKLSNPRIKQTAEYEMGSDSFTTPSLRTVADSYHAGVGLNLLSCACSATIWSVEAGYDYYWRTDGYAANQVSMRVSRRF